MRGEFFNKQRGSHIPIITGGGSKRYVTCIQWRVYFSDKTQPAMLLCESTSIREDCKFRPK